WSSDVCSSDLISPRGLPSPSTPDGTGRVYFLRRTARAVPRFSCWPHLLGKETRPMTTTQAPLATGLEQIGETTTLAVSYLRVSTKEQASKAGQDDGFYIPAQRPPNR